MAMQTEPARDGEPNADINTTPLIDVMLVLLVMLIVTLPPQRHAIKLDTPLPCGADCPEDKAPDPITIALDFDGSLSWNGATITLADLDQRLAAEARRAKQPEIHIRPSRLTKYGAVAHVMAAAQRQGLGKLGVMASS